MGKGIGRAGGEGALQAARGAEAATGKRFPTVTSFSVVKRDGQFHALAIQTRGREVVNEKVLDSSEWLDATSDRCELAAKDFWLFGVDPFREVEGE